MPVQSRDVQVQQQQQQHVITWSHARWVDRRLLLVPSTDDQVLSEEEYPQAYYLLAVSHVQCNSVK